MTFRFPDVLCSRVSFRLSVSQVDSRVILRGSTVNNFMRCHRFDLVRCRKPTRYSVTGPIVYTIIHLPVYGSFPDSFLHSAASNYLTSLDTAFCILVGNCAQAIHNSQAGRPVSSGRPAFPSLLLNCPFNPHTSPNRRFAYSCPVPL